MWCRQDICLLSSPPLRTSFGSQNTRIYHDYIPLPLSLFWLHKNGLQSFRKYHSYILLIPMILTMVHTSGSVHCRRRYGDPELARFFVYLFWLPIQIWWISVISLSYRTCHISMDRSLWDDYDYDYSENMGISLLVMEKFLNYLLYLEKTSCPLFYWQYLDSPPQVWMVLPCFWAVWDGTSVDLV